MCVTNMVAISPVASPEQTWVELPGNDHTPFAGDFERLLNEAQDFITGSRLVPVLDRVLATVLFTDIVESNRPCCSTGRSALEGGAQSL